MAGRAKWNWRCSSTAASASCRSPRNTSARRLPCPRETCCGWFEMIAVLFPYGSPMRNPQLNDRGELQHLLTIEGLPREILIHILDTAQSFVGVTEREVKKVPLLRGKSVFNLFFENSTRTRTTFEIAAKR